jgi:glycosyltransferase involved in cell wall biosynthesis
VRDIMTKKTGTSKTTVKQDEEKKTVLLISHGITGNTGFAKQLYLQGRALVEAGHEVLVVHRDYRGESITFPRGCNATLNSGRPIDGMTFLPVGNQQWGEDILPYYVKKYEPDVVHTLGDIWCYQFIPQIPRSHKMNWLAHYVFDTENLVGFWNTCVSNASLAVVPSKNSFEMLEFNKHENIKYVPHGIDTNVFTPCKDSEKREFRKEIGLPEDAFIIGMVAHNQYRKMVNRLIDAFQLFQSKNRDALLVLHCVPKDNTGWDLPQIIKDKNLQRSIFFTDKASKGFGDLHVTDADMRKLYCAMDVHGLPTGGEGFGIPIVEAMACGIPNVVTSYTTTKEFLTTPDKSVKDGFRNERGIAVPYVDAEMHHTGGFWAKIDVGSMAGAFQYLKDNQGEAKTMGMKARKFAVRNYNEPLVKKEWAKLYSDMDGFLAEIEANRPTQTNGLRTMRIQ